MDTKGFGFFFGILLAIGVGIGFAVSLPRPPTSGTPYAEFQQHRLQWNQAKPAAYRMKVEFSSAWVSWNGSTRVSSDGRVDFFVDGRPVRSVPDGAYRDGTYFVQTIDDVFAMLDAEYTAKAHTIRVEFDTSLHYPTHVSFSQNGHMDDGWQLWLSEMAPR